MNTSRTILTSKLTANLTKTACRGLTPSATATFGLRCKNVLLKPMTIQASRQFSTSRKAQLEFFQPPKDLPHIKQTPASWPHPGVTELQLKSVEIAHREPRTFSDKVAYNMVRFARFWTDLATGYRHDPNKPYVMNERKWLIRFIFLETVAGVPGMVSTSHTTLEAMLIIPDGWYAPTLPLITPNEARQRLDRDDA
jgi:hypothetical protein